MLTAKRGRGAREFRRVAALEVFSKRPGAEYYRLRLECGHEEERRVRSRSTCDEDGTVWRVREGTGQGVGCAGKDDASERASAGFCFLSTRVDGRGENRDIVAAAP